MKSGSKIVRGESETSSIDSHDRNSGATLISSHSQAPNNCHFIQNFHPSTFDICNEYLLCRVPCRHLVKGELVGEWEEENGLDKREAHL